MARPIRISHPLRSTPTSVVKTKDGTGKCPVVCVGGSAGGLDAYTRLLRHLPANLGVAVVIVNHLRTVATRLHEILPRFTAMPVELITERLIIRPNHVFIIPERRDLHVIRPGSRTCPKARSRAGALILLFRQRTSPKRSRGLLVRGGVPHSRSDTGDRPVHERIAPSDKADGRISRSPSWLNSSLGGQYPTDVAAVAR